jgi:hypothetical protein
MTEHRLRNRSIMTTVALAGIAILAYALWPASHPAAVAPRTRVYADYTACLLTGAAGTAQDPAAAVWAGMEQASNHTSERVSTLPITGPQNLALALRNCDLIVTAGALPDQAAEARATVFPHQRFLVIGGTGAQKDASVFLVGGLGRVVDTGQPPGLLPNVRDDPGSRC